MIVVIMGVSGSGKTTIGTVLADALRCSFLEGDSLHSKENIEKMSHGIPLNDCDRSRLKHRPEHFMKANMLDSQFEALEEPSDAIVVDLTSFLCHRGADTRSVAATTTFQNDAAPQDVKKKRVVG